MVGTAANTPTCPVCESDLVCPTCTRETFEKPLAIIGEGAADAHFLAELCKSRGLTQFQIARPANSKDSFGTRLLAIDSNSYRKSMSTILLVCDSDDDPQRAFEHVAEQVNDTKLFARPTAPLTVGPKQPQYPSIAILTLPWIDKPGCLETLLYRAVGADPAYNRLTAPIEGLLSGAPTATCTVCKRAKARLACMVAAACVDDPSCAASALWYSKKGFRHLLASTHFDQVVTYLQTL
jgi:hypothetical protein